MRSVDVIIVGGGCIGLSAALALAQQEFNVALIDQKPLNALFDASEFDTRVFALNAASEELLTQIEVYKDMQAFRVAPYLHMKVWDGKGDGEIHFNGDQRLENHLGVIVEQQVLNAVLVNKCLQSPRVHVFAPSAIKHLDPQGNVKLDTGETLQAKVVVGADGAKSFVRESLGIHAARYSYHQKAIVATLTCEKPHAHTAYQCFQEKGPVALLPLSDPHFVSLVWSTSVEHAQTLMSATESVFCHRVTSMTDFVLGKMTLSTPRASFELTKQHASAYWRGRCVLVGDSAHVVHPLAGQGMNLGFLDVACLTQHLMMWRQKGEINLSRFLARYQRQRKAHVRKIMMGMDAFHHGFTSQKLSLITLRNLGFHLTNQSQWLKNLFIDFALGKTENKLPNARNRRLNGS